VSRGRSLADASRTLVVVLVAALAVALVRSSLFEQRHRIQMAGDVYGLPPPKEVVLLSLGYRSALADLLWAHLLVEQGLHHMERRRYENIVDLLDAINELDPTFRDPYRLADALITFNAKQTPIEEVRRARAIMERGVQNRPLDAELWLGLGQFTAFIAPGSYLTDPAEREQWRLDGARMLARAAELSGDDSNIAWQAMGGARYLSRAGARDAEIRFLQRTLVVTNDEELKEKARARLDYLLGAKRDEEVFERLEREVVDMRHHDIPFVTRRRYMVLGPPRDPAACAGPLRSLAPQCAATFRDWEERSEAARSMAP
jgi:tetratricopeptide (TPR) repeat protein